MCDLIVSVPDHCLSFYYAPISSMMQFLHINAGKLVLQII